MLIFGYLILSFCDKLAEIRDFHINHGQVFIVGLTDIIICHEFGSGRGALMRPLIGAVLFVEIGAKLVVVLMIE